MNLHGPPPSCLSTRMYFVVTHTHTHTHARSHMRTCMHNCTRVGSRIEAIPTRYRKLSCTCVHQTDILASLFHRKPRTRLNRSVRWYRIRLPVHAIQQNPDVCIPAAPCLRAGFLPLTCRGEWHGLHVHALCAPVVTGMPGESPPQGRGALPSWPQGLV